MPKAQIRDAHLPSPEVCDWLLSLEWSEPGSIGLNIPTATFPNVQREVREEQQGQEKAQAEEKVPDAGEKVKPALTQPPSRKTGGKVDPKTPIV